MSKGHVWLSVGICPLLDISIFRVVTPLSSPAYKYLSGTKYLWARALPSSLTLALTWILMKYRPGSQDPE